MKITLMGILLILVASNLYAGLFKITNISGGVAAEAAAKVLETEINSGLPDADQSTYLLGMGNSSLMANKGAGVDYASDISIMEFAWGFGVGADLGENSLTDLIGGSIDGSQVKGFGIQTSILLGLHLGIFPGGIGPFDFDSTNVYLQFMSMDTPDVGGFKGDFSVFSGHVQYKWIKPASIGIIKWGGVDFTTGFEYSSLKLNYTKNFNKAMSASGETATINADINVGADITTYSIPFELSTNFRMLYVFTPYFGLAGDLNFGSAKSIVSASPTITMSVGTASGELDLGQETDVDLFTMRGFMGIQLSVPIVKLYLQIQKSFSVDTWGANFGFRLAW